MSSRSEFEHRHTGGIVFLPIWWVAWTAGIVGAFVALASSGNAFFGIWLLLAIPFWVAVPAIWLWWLIGYEEILVDRNTLTIGKRVLSLHFDKAYPFNGVHNLRAAGFFGDPWKRQNYWSVNGYWWGVGGGMVAFEEDGQTRRFGINLGESEAVEITTRLRRFIDGVV